MSSHDRLNPALNTPPSYNASIAPRPPATSSKRFSNQQREPTEHVFSLYDSRETPWATLKLLSNVPSTRSLPSYFDGQTVSGRVELALSKPESILAVTVTLSGTIVATNANPFTFWELSHTLWSTDMGDPRGQQQSGSPAHSQSIGERAKYTGKLIGAYVWPFAIALPSTCNISLRPKQPPVTLNLPPSFSERGAAQFINYEINVRIRRGTLRIDSKYVIFNYMTCLSALLRFSSLSSQVRVRTNAECGSRISFCFQSDWGLSLGSRHEYARRHLRRCDASRIRKMRLYWARRSTQKAGRCSHTQR